MYKPTEAASPTADFRRFLHVWQKFCGTLNLSLRIKCFVYVAPTRISVLCRIGVFIFSNCITCAVLGKCMKQNFHPVVWGLLAAACQVRPKKLFSFQITVNFRMNYQITYKTLLIFMRWGCWWMLGFESEKAICRFELMATV